MHTMMSTGELFIPYCYTIMIINSIKLYSILVNINNTYFHFDKK